MSDEKSLIDLSKITEPATVLIEKISNAIGVLYEPTRIVKIAQAKAHIDLIEFNSKKNLSEIEQRTIASFLSREKIKQENIENITKGALSSLLHDATPEEISPDWLSFFFNKCEIISESEMQRVWGEILARKASSPTEYSKKTLSTLALLETSDAEEFTKFCSFTAVVDEVPELFIFDVSDEYYKDHGVNFGAALHLQSLGLIHYSSNGYALDVTELAEDDDLDEDHKKLPLKYFDSDIEIALPKYESFNIYNDKFDISTGEVNFTAAGRELYALCNAKKKSDFTEYWSKRLSRDNRFLRTII